MKWTQAVFFGCLAAAAACSSPGSPTSGTPQSAGKGASSSSGASSSGDGSNSGSSGSGSSGSGSSGSVSASGSSGASSGSNGSSGSSSGGDSGTLGPDATTTTVAEAPGCGSTKLLAVPDDTSAPGPWPVGVKTAMVTMTGGSRPVEVWYPATIGSNAGVAQTTYDPVSWLPTSEQQKVLMNPMDDKIQTCDCYRDLPIDSSHGPYPVVIFLHGTASFRTASLSTMTTWASRGFIAVAADHAGLYLADFLVTLGAGCTGGSGVSYLGGSNLSADVDAMIAEITGKKAEFAFLGNSADMSRIGIGGHSQGASDAASYSNKPNVQIDIPLADLGGTVPPATSALKSVLVAGGASDTVVPYSSDTAAYTGSTAPIKRLVGITGGEHLDVTDLCWQTNAAGLTAIQVANKDMVCGIGILNSLAKCGNVMPPKAGPEIVNYVTTAALEETLHCANRDAAFAALKTKFPQVSDYQHKP